MKLMTTLSALIDSGGSKTKNFLPFKFSASRRGVWGEPQIKMIGNFWALPRASLSSAGEAQVSSVKILRILFEIHSNFVQYTPYNTAMTPKTGAVGVYAEGVGFKPTFPFREPVFETGALNHS